MKLIQPTEMLGDRVFTFLFYSWRDDLSTLPGRYLTSLFPGRSRPDSSRPYHKADSEVVGLKAFPRDERPSVLVTFLSFRLMVGLGLLFILLAFIGVWKSFRGRLEASPRFLKTMLYGIPLSYLAVQLGWLVTEMGRQPWIVYGVMKTSAGVSSTLQPSQVIASLIGFTLVYGLLAVIDVYLLIKYSRRGPDDDLSSFLKPSSGKEA